MDSSKREQFANMESQMLDEYTQNIMKNGLRPMFEFSFFKVCKEISFENLNCPLIIFLSTKEDVKNAAAELAQIKERDKLLYASTNDEAEATTLFR